MNFCKYSALIVKIFLIIGFKLSGRSFFLSTQLGEYFRVFVSYGVITLSLVLYEMRKKRESNDSAQLLETEQESKGE